VIGTFQVARGRDNASFGEWRQTMGTSRTRYYPTLIVGTLFWRKVTLIDNKLASQKVHGVGAIAIQFPYTGQRDPCLGKLRSLPQILSVVGLYRGQSNAL
jgi:hypothetical protein